MGDNMAATSTRFRGPLFIVGMARSGTTLLRGLLKGHPRIYMPDRESKFIPLLIEKFGEVPSFDNPEALDALIAQLRRSTFCQVLAERGADLDANAVRRAAISNHWPDIFRTVVLAYADKAIEEDTIWGDKTPNYVNCLPLLSRLFPSARFIHIIRDPRDIALSCRNTWGMSLYRAADRWNNTVLRARVDAAQMSNRYLEVRYEALLEQTQQVLETVCEFIECTFLPDMSRLRNPVGTAADTRDRTDIVSTNTRKFLNHLSEHEIRRIEEIAWPAMTECSYEILYANTHRPLSKLGHWLYRGLDSMQSYRNYIRDKGLVRGLVHRRQQAREHNTRL